MMIMVEQLKKGDCVKVHNFTQTLLGTVERVFVDDDHTILHIDARESDAEFPPRVYMNGTPLQVERSIEEWSDTAKMQLQQLAGTL
jgi:hypothetical protein